MFHNYWTIFKLSYLAARTLCPAMEESAKQEEAVEVLKRGRAKDMELNVVLGRCWPRPRTWEGTIMARATAVTREARQGRASLKAQVIPGASTGSRATTVDPAAMVLQEVTAVGEAEAVLTILHGSRATAILMAVAVVLSTPAPPLTMVPTLELAPPTTRLTQGATPTPVRATTSRPASRAAQITPTAPRRRAQGLPVSSVVNQGARLQEVERLGAATIPRRLQAVLELMGELVRAQAPAQMCQVLVCQQTQLFQVLLRCR